jgi:YHS domain-containing protein
MNSGRYTVPAFLAACVVTLGLIGGASQLSAQTKAPVNVDAQGVGIHGYDPVAYFSDGKAVKGDPQYRSQGAGATYYFQSAANKEAFDKEPAKYAPQYGGYCAMAMAMGKLEDVDPNYFLVYEEKLLLQRNAKAHMMFSKDPEGNRRKADENWLKLQTQQSN